MKCLLTENDYSSFNPVCRELGAPPASSSWTCWIRSSFQSRLPGVGGSAPRTWPSSKDTSAFNPVCRELGAPPRSKRLDKSASIFQSRLPGVGGSAPSTTPRGGRSTAFQSRLPGVGGSAECVKRSLSEMLTFNPVCRELGAPPSMLCSAPMALASFNPVCRELGAPPREAHLHHQFRHLSIPFAGSWGLRRATTMRPAKSKLGFQSRLPGVGGSAHASGPRGGRVRLTFNPVCRELGAPPMVRGIVDSAYDLSIPFAGSWGLRLYAERRNAEAPAFNPVCRELGAPPPRRHGDGGPRHGGAFNPVCRELGAPPSPSTTLRGRRIATFNPVCRELGAPPLGGAGVPRRVELSIPFAGSWGLRQGSAASRRHEPFQSRLPGVGGSAGLEGAIPEDLYLFQSRLPGVGGSASRCLPGPPSRSLFQSRLPGVGGSAPGRGEEEAL